MRQPLSVFVGLRYASTRRSSALVSFLSRISMIGLAVSVGLLILVLSVMNGFDREMRTRILGLVPQVTVHHVAPDGDWRQVLATAEAHPQVRAAAPFLQLDGLLLEGRAVAGALVYGIDVEREERVSIVGDYFEGTSLRELAASQWGAVLGKAMAARLGVAPGESVTLVLPTSTGGNLQPKLQRLQVLGTVDTGTELDQNLALLRLVDARQLQPRAEQGVDIRLALRDIFAAPSVAWHIEQQLPYGYYVQDWTRTHGNLYSAIQLSRQLVSMMLAIIIAVAAFNVVSTLVMVVNDKQGDIAILRSQGARPGTILRIFMLQGTIIGTVGTVTGALLGALLSLGVPVVVPALEQLSGYQFLNTDVYPIDYLPVDLRLSDILLVSAVAVAMSFLATLYPAWRAARINPAEALRYD